MLCFRSAFWHRIFPIALARDWESWRITHSLENPDQEVRPHPQAIYCPWLPTKPAHGENFIQAHNKAKVCNLELPDCYLVRDKATGQELGTRMRIIKVGALLWDKRDVIHGRRSGINWNQLTHSWQTHKNLQRGKNNKLRIPGLWHSKDRDMLMLIACPVTSHCSKLQVRNVLSGQYHNEAKFDLTGLSASQTACYIFALRR